MSRPPGPRLAGRSFDLSPGCPGLARRCHFEACEFRPAACCHGLDWSDCRFESCAFAGAFAGCDFGPGPGRDFRAAALLHLCRFFGDAAGLLLPGWPHFAVLGPAANRAALAGLPWPDGLLWAPGVAAACPPGVAAVTFHWPLAWRRRPGPRPTPPR